MPSITQVTHVTVEPSWHGGLLTPSEVSPARRGFVIRWGRLDSYNKSKATAVVEAAVRSMRRRRLTLAVLSGMVALGPLLLLVMFPGDESVGEPWQLGAFSIVFGIPAVAAFVSLLRLRQERIFSRLHEVCWVWRRAFRSEIHEELPVTVVNSRAIYICFSDGSRFTISGLKSGLDEVYEALQTLCPRATFGYSSGRAQRFAREPGRLMRSAPNKRAR